MAQVFPSEAQIAGATAGGDLSGTYPDPTVVALQGHAIDSVAPTAGDALTWSGTKWEPNTTAAGVSSFAGRTGAVTPALSDYGVEISAGETKTANNTLDDGLGNVAIAGTAVNVGPSSGTANTILTVGGQGTNTGNGTVEATGPTMGQFMMGAGTAVTNIHCDTAGELFIEAGTADIYLRPTVGSNNGMTLVGTGGALSTYNASGLQRNVLDDGSGNVTIAGTIATKGLTPATLTPVSGTAFQCSTTADAFLYAPVSATVAGTVKVETSPDNVTYYTLDAGRAVGTVGDSPVTLYVRKGWYVRLTTVSGTLTYGTATYY